MGTRLDVIFWGLERLYAQNAFQAILNEVHRLESELSQYDEQSTIAAINRAAGMQPVQVSDEVFSVLSQCKHYYRQTSYMFDITATSGPASYANSFDADSVSTDSPENYAGAEALELNAQHTTAFLPQKGMRIDPGGIGKGIALQNIKQILLQNGVYNAFISFGESSILGLGNHPYGDCWKVGVSLMDNSDQSVCSFELRDASLSTSGTDKSDGHIIDPHTGKPSGKTGTVSVVSESPVEAEVLSTALLVAGEENRERILKRFNPERVVEITYAADNSPAIYERYNKTETNIT